MDFTGCSIMSQKQPALTRTPLVEYRDDLYGIRDRIGETDPPSGKPRHSMEFSHAVAWLPIDEPCRSAASARDAVGFIHHILDQFRTPTA